MFLDVIVQAEDGFGKAFDSMHVFWWDGGRLKDVLGERLEPADPWPAWECLMSPCEVRELVQKNPPVWSAKGEAFSAKLLELLDKARGVRIRIEES